MNREQRKLGISTSSVHCRPWRRWRIYQEPESQNCLNPLKPIFFWLWQKWVYQSIQRYTGLTYHFLFFDIRALWRSVLSAPVPECQKIEGLDEYGVWHWIFEG